MVYNCSYWPPENHIEHQIVQSGFTRHRMDQNNLAFCYLKSTYFQKLNTLLIWIYSESWILAAIRMMDLFIGDKCWCWGFLSAKTINICSLLIQRAQTCTSRLMSYLLVGREWSWVSEYAEHRLWGHHILALIPIFSITSLTSLPRYTH